MLNISDCMEQIGIYSIRNIANGKIYVGSSVNISQRWKHHKSRLNNNSHDNLHLNNAWKEYGADAFEFSIIEICPINMLIIREQAWIDYYCSFNREKGYNILEVAGSVLGMRHSEETIKKMCLFQKGHPVSDETKRKISIANKGKIRSEEVCKKIGFGHIGMRHTEEAKRKISEGNRGKIMSEEAKRKIGKANSKEKQA
jgi:group I intron endonuclease